MWKFPGPPPGRPARVPQGPRRAGRPPIAGKFSAETPVLSPNITTDSGCAQSCLYKGKRAQKGAWTEHYGYYVSLAKKPSKSRRKNGPAETHGLRRS